MPVATYWTRWGHRAVLRSRRMATWMGVRRDLDAAPTERQRSSLRLACGVALALGCVAAAITGIGTYQHGLAIERSDPLHGYRVIGRVRPDTAWTDAMAGGPDSQGMTLTSTRPAVVTWVDRAGTSHRNEFLAGDTAIRRGSITLCVALRWRRRSAQDLAEEWMRVEPQWRRRCLKRSQRRVLR